jgi:hypothetical protein
MNANLKDISEWILACIAGNEDDGTKPRTPLLIDTSEDRKMATFFKYLLALTFVGFIASRCFTARPLSLVALDMIGIRKTLPYTSSSLFFFLAPY